VSYSGSTKKKKNQAWKGAGRGCDAKWNSSVLPASKRNHIRTLKETGSIAQINVQCLKAAKNILYTQTVRLEGAGRFISAEAIPFPKRALKTKKKKEKGE